MLMLGLLMALAVEIPVSSPVPETPIMGGEATAPGEFDEVVGMNVGVNRCTGTLVASDLVITAAHCVEAARDLITVFWGPEIVAANSITASSWASHPDYCPQCKKNAYDFGYVLLSRPLVFGPASPVVDQQEWDDAMQKGGVVEIVGYGATDDTSGSTAGLGVKRVASTPIESFTPGGLEFYAGGDGKDSCKGDSGGPAFIRTESGARRLAGILSRGTVPCGGGGYYGVPYTALCWLRDQTMVNLLPTGCETCECLDTAPPDEGGCRVVPPEEGRSMVGPGLLVLVIGAHRRRGTLISDLI